MNLLLLLAVILVKISHLVDCYKHQLYKTYRLEKLCSKDGGKVNLVMDDVVSTFYLNSSLVPGSTFSCHIEMFVRAANTGFFVYFEEMNLFKPGISSCTEDYVEFGRDILFVTSHLSGKYCGRMEKVAVSHCDKNGTETQKQIPQLKDRFYTEESDSEMDIWIRVDLSKANSNTKTLSLVVTPFKKSCSRNDKHYRRCGNTQRCIRKELFCDGQINCAALDNKPLDEKNCSWMGEALEQPSEWSSDLPWVQGFVILSGCASLLLAYLGFKFMRKQRLTKRGEVPVLEQQDLILLNSRQYQEGTSVVPVENPSCPPLPPPYSQIEQSDVIPQYSYNNR